MGPLNQALAESLLTLLAKYVLYCKAQFQFSASQVELRLALLSLSVPPTHVPGHWASIFKPLLDYLGSGNLVWKLYSTEQGQLASLPEKPWLAMIFLCW